MEAVWRDCINFLPAAKEILVSTLNYSPLSGECHGNEISIERNFADVEVYFSFELLIPCKECTDIWACTLGSYVLKTLFSLPNILQKTVQAALVL